MVISNLSSFKMDYNIMGISYFFGFGIGGKERHSLRRAVFMEDNLVLEDMISKYGDEAIFEIVKAEIIVNDYVTAPILNDISYIKKFIKKYGNDCVNAKGNRGETALFNTVTFLNHNNNDHTILNILLDNGADPNISDRRGRTPLYMAFLYENYKTIEILLKAGVSIENTKKTTFSYVEEGSEIETLLQKYKIIRQKEKTEAFNAAAEKAKVESKKSIEEFWVVNPDDDIVKYIEEGDIKNLRDVFDRVFYTKQKIKLTSDHLKAALLRQDRPILRLLISYGAKFSKEDFELMKNNNTDNFNKNIKILKACGMDISCQTKPINANKKKSNPNSRFKPF